MKTQMLDRWRFIFRTLGNHSIITLIYNLYELVVFLISILLIFDYVSVMGSYSSTERVHIFTKDLIKNVGLCQCICTILNNEKHNIV